MSRGIARTSLSQAQDDLTSARRLNEAEYLRAVAAEARVAEVTRDRDDATRQVCELEGEVARLRDGLAHETREREAWQASSCSRDEALMRAAELMTATAFRIDDGRTAPNTLADELRDGAHDIAVARGAQP